MENMQIDLSKVTNVSRQEQKKSLELSCLQNKYGEAFGCNDDELFSLYSFGLKYLLNIP